MSSNSIFKNFFVPKAVDLTDANFVRRLKKLEELMIRSYDIEVIPTGWKCTSKAPNKPGFVVTADSVMFIMKNLGI